MSSLKLSLRAALFVLASSGLACPAQSSEWPFTGQLEIRTSAGIDPSEGQLLSVPLSGSLEIVGGVLDLPAGVISAPVPDLFGFGGTLANGPGRFSPAGAGAGSSCPLTQTQEICIDGGGYGGSMLLSGLTQLGQDLQQPGVPGTHVGTTRSGVVRAEAGTNWTRGGASAWYFIPEIDPTPFALMGSGTWRGLPSTFDGPGDAGLTLVTPMMVTTGTGTSQTNVRALARIRIDFAARPVPNAIAAVVAAGLAGLGVARLRAAQRAALLR